MRQERQARSKLQAMERRQEAAQPIPGAGRKKAHPT